MKLVIRRENEKKIERKKFTHTILTNDIPTLFIIDINIGYAKSTKRERYTRTKTNIIFSIYTRFKGKANVLASFHFKILGMNQNYLSLHRKEEQPLKRNC